MYCVQDKFDAYLISESSLFVYADKIIVLTCGTTLLLKTLPAFIAAGAAIGLDVHWFQYSRKNFLFPEKQHAPHKSFDMELSYLLPIFPTGKPFILGSLASDHWYLFVADFVDRQRGSGDTNERKVLDQDQMLNVYMYGIDPYVAQLFVKADPVILPSIFSSNNLEALSQASTPSMRNLDSSSCSSSSSSCGGDEDNVKDHNQHKENKERREVDEHKDRGVGERKAQDVNSAAFEGFNFCATADEATERSGIAALMGSKHAGVCHAHLFDPCGYSMNGSAADGEAYWTIHITPEASCSYASFETNLSTKSYHELVQRIIKVFRPTRFTTVEHIDQDSMAGLEGALTPANVDGYKTSGRTLTEVGCKDYVVHMCNYECKHAGSNVAPPPACRDRPHTLHALPNTNECKQAGSNVSSLAEPPEPPVLRPHKLVA